MCPNRHFSTDDNEFYVGKRKVARSEIEDSVLKLLANQPGCSRSVYIKSAAKVKFESLEVVVRELRGVDVNRIEFVLDKKKKAVL